MTGVKSRLDAWSRVREIFGRNLSILKSNESILMKLITIFVSWTQVSIKNFNENIIICNLISKK